MSQDIDNLLAVRARTHGDYADHAAVTQQVKAVFHTHPGWARLSDIQRETLDMVAHKAGRILAGNPDIVDHWDDIAGYARLVSQRLEPVVYARPPLPPAVARGAERAVASAVASAVGNGDAEGAAP